MSPFDDSQPIEKPEVGLEGRETLRPQDIAPANSKVVTIERIERVPVRDGDRGNRNAYVMLMTELPDHLLWLNREDTALLIESFGPIPAAWRGRKVPLVVYNGSFQKRRGDRSKETVQYSTLHLAPRVEWDRFDGLTTDEKPVARSRRKSKGK